MRLWRGNPYIHFESFHRERIRPAPGGDHGEARVHGGADEGNIAGARVYRLFIRFHPATNPTHRPDGQESTLTVLLLNGEIKYKPTITSIATASAAKSFLFIFGTIVERDY